MTEKRKKGGGKRSEPAQGDSAGKGTGGEDFKIVELGIVEDEDALLDEISVQLENLEADDDSADGENTAAAAAKSPPPKSAPRPEQSADRPEPARAAPVGKIKASAQKKKSTSASPSAAAGSGASGPAGVSGQAVSHRRKLEKARMRSATAARKARQNKTGKRILVFIAAGALLLGLSGAAGFYLFKPDSPTSLQQPVKFAVKNAPGIKIEASEQPPAKVISLEEKSAPPAKAAPEKTPPVKEAKNPAGPGAEAAAEKPRQTVRRFLSSWQSAWEASAGENGRIDPYIAHFSKDFRSRDMDRDAWKADKAAKNRRKEWIRVRIDDVQVLNPSPAGTVTVRFVQTYESSNYSDRTEKTLVLKPEEGRWKILGFGGST